MHTVLSIVKSIIGTKQISRLQEKELDYISVLVVESFLNSINSSVNASWSPNIRYLQIMGDVMKSHTIKGIALDFGLPVEAPKVLKNIKLALFNVSLVPAEMDTENYTPLSKNITIQLELNESNADPYKPLLELAKAIVSAGVTMVACQKLIHPFLQRYFLDNVGNCKIFLMNRVLYRLKDCLIGTSMLLNLCQELPS